MHNRLGVFLVITVLIATLLGGWLGDKVRAGGSLEKDTNGLLKTFTSALATIQQEYVKEVPTGELVESAIRGLLRTLDPHSSFFATSDYNRLQEEQQGKYFGLGISIRPEAPGSGRVVIVEPPTPGTPAYKVGLKVGDVIAKIEGQSIENWDINREVIPNLKGPKGTKVRITVQRPEEPEPLEFTVERDEIPLYTIKFAFQIAPSIGYIQIIKFSETTGKELGESLEELQEAALTGLVLDLRDNLGGALSQAIEVADRFLEKGQLIVRTRGRQGKGHEYRAPKGRHHDYPMVVLINENSASASEIVAGALQDHYRALIVGENSFGKALVQTIYPLQGNRGLALTTGKYYTPSNRLIQRDYSDSFYDYFYSRTQVTSGSDQKPTPSEDAPSGGISPDFEISLKLPSKLGRLIDRKNLFYEFATKLTSGEVLTDVRYQYSRQEREKLTPEERDRLIKELAVTDQTLSSFQDFLRQRKVKFKPESFEEIRDLILNGLKREIFLSLFGEREGYRIGLEMDHQLQKAVELLPRARELAYRDIPDN